MNDSKHVENIELVGIQLCQIPRNHLYKFLGIGDVGSHKVTSETNLC